MTRATMVRVIAKVLAGRPGLSPAEQAERITDALEAVVEAELGADTSSIVTSGESTTSPRTTLNPTAPVGAIPPSPAVKEGRPPRVAEELADPPAQILVVPQDAALFASEYGRSPSISESGSLAGQFHHARKELLEDAGNRLLEAADSRAREAARPTLIPREPAQVYRSMDQLKQQLYAGTPETLTIEVPGRKGGLVKLTLERNIIMDVGLGGGGARLVYKHPRAPDGMEAFAVFSCADPALDIDFVLERIEQQAVEIHSPRNRSGNIRVEVADAPMPSTIDPKDILFDVPIRFE